MRILSRVFCFWVLIVLWTFVVIGMFSLNTTVTKARDAQLAALEYKVELILSNQAQVKKDLESTVKETQQVVKAEILDKLVDLKK